MFRLEQILTGISDWVGKTIPWLILPLAFITLSLAVSRYGFHFSSIGGQEIPIYLNAILTMSCIGFALHHNQHVRVDIFYSQLTNTTKHWINLLGSIFLLLPICFVIAGVGFDYAYNSWTKLEKSPELDGLPLVFVLKSLIPLMAILLLIQGVANILYHARSLQQPKS